jgi:CBS domain-containing protein
MKVRDCMCKDVCFVKPETTIYDIAKLMECNGIGCIPICDGNNSIVGLVTDRDLVLRTIACNKDAKTTPVSEIMTTNVCCCEAEEDINEAQTKMANNQIRRLPVLENNKVIGILTLGDLAHWDKKIGKEEVCTTIENICNCEGQVKNGK